MDVQRCSDEDQMAKTKEEVGHRNGWPRFFEIVSSINISSLFLKCKFLLKREEIKKLWRKILSSS